MKGYNRNELYFVFKKIFKNSSNFLSLLFAWLVLWQNSDMHNNSTQWCIILQMLVKQMRFLDKGNLLSEYINLYIYELCILEVLLSDLILFHSMQQFHVSLPRSWLCLKLIKLSKKEFNRCGFIEILFLFVPFNERNLATFWIVYLFCLYISSFHTPE